jgi:hypothetical protein
MANPILVTGAAGRGRGRTHNHRLLFKQGREVRAMVRNEDERAQIFLQPELGCVCPRHGIQKRTLAFMTNSSSAQRAIYQVVTKCRYLWHMLCFFMGSSDERGEIRLFNVACLRGVLRSARSKNLERTMPITRTLPGWMEVAVGCIAGNHFGDSSAMQLQSADF